MKLVYMVWIVFVFVGCEQKSKNRTPTINPSRLKAVGPADELQIALGRVLDASAPKLNPATACPREVTDYLGSISAECGALRVPTDHRAITSKSVGVGYMKIPQTYDPAKPLLVIEQGGPGGSSIMLAAAYVMINDDLVEEFNILAVEQRGTLWTYPNATCETVVDIEIKVLEKNLDAAAGQLAIDEANKKCLKRTSQIMDISKISTYQIAKDIVYAAGELGFDVFNFYGVSYGTVVGQYLIEYSDQHVANIVLDSPAVVGKLWMNDAMENMDSLAEARFDSYRQMYLSNMTLSEAIDHFKSASQVFEISPISASVPHPNGDFSLVVDADFFLDLVFQMLVVYSEDSIAKMLMDAAETAKTDQQQAKLVFEFLLPQLQLTGQSNTSIMYQSIVCREFSFADLNFKGSSENWTFLPKLLSPETLDKLVAEASPCTLNLPKTDQDVILKSPIASDKKVLVVGGEFDYVTNPRYVSEVAANMPNAFTDIFKGASHGVYTAQECITESINDYLLSPTAAYSNLCSQ